MNKRELYTVYTIPVMHLDFLMHVNACKNFFLLSKQEANENLADHLKIIHQYRTGLYGGLRLPKSKTQMDE